MPYVDLAFSSVMAKCYVGKPHEETNVRCRALMNGLSAPREMIPFPISDGLRRKARFQT